MIKQLVFRTITILLPVLGEARIIETSKIADVLPLIDQNTWFLVDLDNTLFEAQQALGHAQWFYEEVQNKIDTGLTREEAIRALYPSWIKTQAICPVKPMEKDFVPALFQLQGQGIVVMGLTHRQPSVAESTLKQVKSLGFEFLTTAPYQQALAIPAKNPALFTGGILFVGDYNKKGEIFPAFLTMIEQKPRKVVFIDDKKKNVDELEEPMDKLGIEYVGVHYTAIEKAEPVYDKKIAAYQSKFLNKIMSNEAAKLLMENGLE